MRRLIQALARLLYRPRPVRYYPRIEDVPPLKTPITGGYE